MINFDDYEKVKAKFGEIFKEYEYLPSRIDTKYEGDKIRIFWISDYGLVKNILKAKNISDKIKEEGYDAELRYDPLACVELSIWVPTEQLQEKEENYYIEHEKLYQIRSRDPRRIIFSLHGCNGLSDEKNKKLLKDVCGMMNNDY